MPKAKSVHSPWNKGKAVGQKAPFTPDQVYVIRQLLHAEGHLRDLALLNTAIDTLLRHDQSLSGQLLQYLSQQLGRNVVMICYLPGAHRLLGMLCQMLEPVNPLTTALNFIFSGAASTNLRQARAVSIIFAAARLSHRNRSRCVRPPTGCERRCSTF